MKISLYILFILPFISFQPPKTMQINAGKKVDKLILKISTIQAAITNYGNNTGFTQGIGCGDHDYYTNRFSFSKQGITVITETIDNEDIKTSIITKIGVSYPCNAETEMGVRLIKDNIGKILKSYGEPEGADTSKTFIDIHYFSKGISFRCDRNQNKIQKIEIYIPEMSPDFWY